MRRSGPTRDFGTKVRHKGAVLDAALQFGATPLELVLSAGAIFGAAVVRGYTGFGFSMIAVTTLSMLRSPAEVVPMVLLLEIVASLHLLPTVWHAVDWRSLGWLLLGTMVATPVGVTLLTIVPANTMRVLVCVAVASAVSFLWRGFELRRTPGPAPTVAAGVLVGILNGSTGIGGPPAILFYFSSPVGHVVSRASLVAYFLAIDALATATGAAMGLIDGVLLQRAGVLLLPLVLGIALGNRQFVHSDPAAFRRVVLVVLMLLALSGLVRALLG
jgi:uncharacterized protein